MTNNAKLAGAALGRLVGLGVRDFVVCAGARNAPLVLSLLARAETLDLHLFHHFDERAAAFFALGLSKRQSRPVAVVTTSGTAVGELLPATIEAHYSGIPLVLVTADRPTAYRGSGAPQAIEQVEIFRDYAEFYDFDTAEDCSEPWQWNRERPLHLNLCFEEPRPEDRHNTWLPEELEFERSPASSFDEAVLLEFCEDREGMLVLLGELEESWRAGVESFVAQLGCPVWAEAASGLRESEVLSDQLLCSDPPRPLRVLRIGGVPSLRLWRDLEAAPELPVLSITRRPFSGLARSSLSLVTTCFPELCLPFEERAKSGGFGRKGSSFDAYPKAEPSMLRELSRQIPETALVYLGNSMPIREWNMAADSGSPHPHCYASRGANGIDGQVSTFLGLSEGMEEAWGIFGDLTTLYDLNAPALLGQLSPGRRRIVVINNGGGRIFSRLSSMAGLEDGEKMVTENRHSRRFESWAAMWGSDYRQWRAGERFPDLGEADTLVLEILPDENETEAFWARR